MASFDSLINASTSAWTTAEGALLAAQQADTNSPAEFARALLNAQLQVSVATSAEQKASSAIDKAYQAHGQVASK